MTTRALRLTLWASLALAGCTDTAADLGRPPPIDLVTARRILVVPLQDGERLGTDGRARLGREVDALAAGEAQAVRARVQAAEPDDGEAVRRALLASGLDPARIAVVPSSAVARLAPVVALSRAFAHTTPCAAAVAPAWQGDPLPSLMSLGRCTQANNLAAMLADPADLVAPPPLAPTGGAAAADALRAWRAQRAAGTPEAPAAGVGSSATGGAGAAGGVPPDTRAAAAPLPVVRVPSGNADAATP